MNRLGVLGSFVRRCGVVCAAMLAAGWALAADAPRLSVERHEDRVTVNIDGALFTEYLTCSGRRPVLWPVIGPTGKAMTRAYPIGASQPGESNDHPHHRSIWFGYEGFNGVDFWHEPDMDGRDRPLEAGRVVHREFVTVRGGDTALIVTRNDYVNDDAGGKLVCKDERTWQFGTDGDARWIDCQIKFLATEGPVELRDTKEGAFAVRVPETMKVDARKGGRIINSNGETDAAAWGRPAEWVDYHGPVDGEHLGIAILVHPTSYRPVPRWHVRTYGLFAVNPFGEDAYLPANSEAQSVAWEARKTVATIPAGQSLTLRYRVILHRGDEKAARIAEAFAAYADE